MGSTSKLMITGFFVACFAAASACDDGGGSGGGSTGTGGGSSSGGGANTGGSMSSGGGAGGGPSCVAAADCPAPAAACQVAACDGGKCTSAPAPDGTLAGKQTDGDCQVSQCQGGAVVSVDDDADALDDGNDCTINTCNGGSPGVAVVPPGSPCAQGSGKVCNVEACVECLDDSHCPGEVCKGNVCAPDACKNGLKDGDEADVDCGGSCVKKCGPGAACGGDADCAGGSCSGGACAPTCTDGVKNGDETDADCGGACPSDCGPGKSCVANADCASALCDAGTLTCTSTCSDGFQGGDESDVDCGGAACAACPVGGTCAADSDCLSTVCDVGACAPLNGCDPALATDLTGQDPVTISFGFFFYDPPCVRVSQGTKVIFNGDFTAHPLAGGKNIGGAKFPDAASPFMPITDAGMSKTFTLLSAGSFAYYCDVHGNMYGAVFVE